MKLAEALADRAALQQQITDLRDRLVRNARVQEGDTPAEDPAELLAALDRAADALERRIVEINRTNLAVEVEPDLSMTAALARRDVLKMRLNVHRALVAGAQPSQDRYSRQEIRFLPTVDVRTAQATVDALARDLRELDTRIQAVNWTADLMA